MGEKWILGASAPSDHAWWRLVVSAVSGTRGSGTAAATLWEETTESRQARELLAFQLKNASTLTFDTGGRPTKRDRREIQRVRNKWP